MGLRPFRLPALAGRKRSSHRFNGHKAQIAVETDTQLITPVEVLAGNASDADHALEVVETSEAATSCQVVEVLESALYICLRARNKRR